MADDGKVSAAFAGRDVPVTYLGDREGRLLAGKVTAQVADNLCNPRQLKLVPRMSQPL